MIRKLTVPLLLIAPVSGQCVPPEAGPMLYEVVCKSEFVALVHVTRVNVVRRKEDCTNARPRYPDDIRPDCESLVARAVMLHVVKPASAEKRALVPLSIDLGNTYIPWRTYAGTEMLLHGKEVKASSGTVVTDAQLLSSSVFQGDFRSRLEACVAAAK